MPYPVKCSFEIYRDMVQILPMLKVLFTEDSEAEDLFCGASPSLNPACSLAIISSDWGLSLLEMTLRYDILYLDD